MPDAALATLIGFLSGVFSGAFGIGGGIVTTPAVRLLLDAPALIAVGTPLPVILPTAITGAISYARRGLVDARAGLTIGLAGAVTAVAGALLATRTGGVVVLVGTAALILYAAADMALQIARPPRHAEQTAAEPDGDHAAHPGADPGLPAMSSATPVTPAASVTVAIGLVAGLYSGFFGLGGGFVIVPLLARWGRLPIKRAIGTSLLAVTLLAVPGTATHAWAGNIDWPTAGLLALGVVPGALLGVRFTVGAADRAVKIAFTVFLVVVGTWLGASEVFGWLS